MSQTTGDTWWHHVFIDGQPWEVELRDRMVSEECMDTVSPYLRTCDGVFVVCNVAPSEDKFRRMCEFDPQQPMMSCLREEDRRLKKAVFEPQVRLLHEFPVVLVGTQTDKDDRKFSRKEGEECAERLGWRYAECSAARKREGVEEVIFDMVRSIRQLRLGEKGDQIITADMAEKRARALAGMWRKEGGKLVDDYWSTPMKSQAEAEKEDTIESKAKFWKRVLHRFQC